MRSRNLAFIVLLLAVGVPAQEQPQEPPKAPAPAPVAPAAVSPEAPPVFPSEIEQVIVDVVVVDKKGNPITDLRKEDITVTEDGDAQALTSFERVELKSASTEAPPARPRVSTNQRPENRTGRSFVVLFDDVHLTPFQAIRAKGAVASFLEKGAAEGDLVTLVASSGAAWWTTRLPQGKDELMAMLKRLDGRYIPDISPERMSDYEAMMIHVYRDQRTIERVNRRYDTYGVNPQGQRGSEVGGNRDFGADADPQVTGRAAETYYSATSRNRITLETIQRMLDSLRTARGRKSMILVSEGFIYDPGLVEFKDVVQAARRSNVAIYFLDTRGLGGISVYATAQFGPALDTQDLGAAFMENLEASEGAESIASDSGGFSVKNTNDLSKGIQRIVAESRHYYLVGYVSNHTARDGKFRKISVKVARKDVQVRARKGYYAPDDTPKKEKKPKPGPDPVLQTALDSPFEEDAIPLRLSSYVFDETLLGKTATLLLADIDVKTLPFVEKEGRLTNTVEYVLVAAHRETGEFFQVNQRAEMKFLPANKAKWDQSGFPVARDFELPPGGYQAKLVVRETNSNRIGTVIHEFEVPDPDEVPRLDPGRDGLPAARARGLEGEAAADAGGAADLPGGGHPLLQPRGVRGREGQVLRDAPGFHGLHHPEGGRRVAVDPRRPHRHRPHLPGQALTDGRGAHGRGRARGYRMVINLRDEVSGETIKLEEPFVLQTAQAAPKAATP